MDPDYAPGRTNVATLEIEGLDQILAKLDKKSWAGAMRATLISVAHLVAGEVATYPPETEANQPRPPNTVFSIKTRRPVNQWYERGLGTRTCSGRIYATSEDLGHSWTTKIAGPVATIGTRVSYARYVQGDLQVGYHGARGWRTIFTVVQQVAPKVTVMFRTVADRLLGPAITKAKWK